MFRQLQIDNLESLKNIDATSFEAALAQYITSTRNDTTLLYRKANFAGENTSPLEFLLATAKSTSDPVLKTSLLEKTISVLKFYNHSDFVKLLAARAELKNFLTTTETSPEIQALKNQIRLYTIPPGYVSGQESYQGEFSSDPHLSVIGNIGNINGQPTIIDLDGREYSILSLLTDKQDGVSRLADLLSKEEHFSFAQDLTLRYYPSVVNDVFKYHLEEGKLFNEILGRLKTNPNGYTLNNIRALTGKFQFENNVYSEIIKIPELFSKKQHISASQDPAGDTYSALEQLFLNMRPGVSYVNNNTIVSNALLAIIDSCNSLKFQGQTFANYELENQQMLNVFGKVADQLLKHQVLMIDDKGNNYTTTTPIRKLLVATFPRASEYLRKLVEVNNEQAAQKFLEHIVGVIQDPTFDIGPAFKERYEETITYLLDKGAKTSNINGSLISRNDTRLCVQEFLRITENYKKTVGENSKATSDTNEADTVTTAQKQDSEFHPEAAAEPDQVLLEYKKLLALDGNPHDQFRDFFARYPEHVIKKNATELFTTTLNATKNYGTDVLSAFLDTYPLDLEKYSLEEFVKRSDYPATNLLSNYGKDVFALVIREFPEEARKLNYTLKNGTKGNLLHYFIDHNDRDNISRLIGAISSNKDLLKDTLNQKDELGRTPLHLASANNAVDIAEYLLARGAKHDALDDNKQTPKDKTTNKDLQRLYDKMTDNDGNYLTAKASIKQEDTQKQLIPASLAVGALIAVIPTLLFAFNVFSLPAILTYAIATLSGLTTLGLSYSAFTAAYGDEHANDSKNTAKNVSTEQTITEQVASLSAADPITQETKQTVSKTTQDIIAKGKQDPLDRAKIAQITTPTLQ